MAFRKQIEYSVTVFFFFSIATVGKLDCTQMMPTHVQIYLDNLKFDDEINGGYVFYQYGGVLTRTLVWSEAQNHLIYLQNSQKKKPKKLKDPFALLYIIFQCFNSIFYFGTFFVNLFLPLFFIGA